MGYILSEITSNVQKQLNNKLSSSGTAVKATADAQGNVIASTYATKTELQQGLANKVELDGLADVALTGKYSDLTGTPTTMKNPTSLTIQNSKGVSLGAYDGSIARTIKLTSATVGLGNVVNESKETMFADAALTGAPTAPTAPAGVSSLQIANTTFVANAIANKTSVTGNAGTASKLKDARTITLTGGVTGNVVFDGSHDVAISTVVVDDSHNHIIANIDGLQAELNLKAPLNSPTFEGVPTAPTADEQVRSSQVATTEFVMRAIENKTEIELAQRAINDEAGMRIIEQYATKTEVQDTYTSATGYTDNAIATLINSAPETLDTLGEIATALEENEQVIDVLNAAIGTKAADADVVKLAGDQTIAGVKTFESTIEGNVATASKLASERTIKLQGDVTGSFVFDGSGDVAFDVAVADDSHAHTISNVDGLQDALDSKATIESPALTGTPTAPTAPTGTSSTQIATTAFVEATVNNKTTITGNAATATKLTNKRTIKLQGDVTGSVEFDGSEDATIEAIVADDSHNHVISNVDGLQDALDEKALKPTGVFYIEGSGDAAGKWTGSHDEIDEYYPGLMIAYKVGVQGAETETTLNVNQLGEAKVVRNAGDAISTHYAIGSVIFLVYTIDNGVAYWKIGDYDSDVTTQTSNLVGQKLYLIGAKVQSETGETTYSNSNVYIGTDNSLYSNGTKVSVEGHTHSTSSMGQAFVECETELNTAAKVANVSGFELVEGAAVYVRFVNGCNANATLNINGTGAHLIAYRNVAITEGIINSGDTVSVVYDGSQWNVIAIDRIRFHPSLIPTGKAIVSSSSAQVDINTVQFLAIGNYYCESNANAKYVANLPISETAFVMEVSSPLGSEYDDETTNKYCYRIRRLTTYTGIEYTQRVYTQGVANEWTFDPWLRVLKTGDNATSATTATLDSAGNNIVNTYATKSELTTGLDSKSNTSHIHDIATQTTNGFLSAADKAKLDGIEEQATRFVHPSHTEASLSLYKVAVDNLGHVKTATAVTKSDITALGIPAQDTVYTLPNATDTVLGGVRVGANITVDTGTISLTKTNVTTALGYTPPVTDTTYVAATTSAAGLMSAADKVKLDGIAEGANNYTYTLPAAGSDLGGVKTTSTVTDVSTYAPCPIVDGVPYYKDTDTTYTLADFGVTATAEKLNFTSDVTSNIQAQLDGKSDNGHTQPTSTINLLTGYTKPTATSALAVGDTLNGALGKLEVALDGKLAIDGTAVKATADGDGNTISTTYAKLSGAEFTGGLSGTTASFSGSVQGATIQATSDRRLKSDLNVIGNPIEKINGLTGYTYTLANDCTGKRAGVIAQDAAKVLPEAVRAGEDGFLSVDYAAIIALCVETNKALIAKIEQLEQKIEQLTK